MKNIVRFFVLAVAMFASATFAKASTFTGGTYYVDLTGANGLTVTGYINVNSNGYVSGYTDLTVAESGYTSLVFSGNCCGGGNTPGGGPLGSKETAYFYTPNLNSGGNYQLEFNYTINATTGAITFDSANSQLSKYSGNGIPAGSFTSGAISVAPEPSSLVLLGTGLIGASALAFRRRRQAA